MRPLESGGRCLVPRLLAVNVGLPKDVPWRGSTVHTGIWKQPVAGPRMVRRLNIDGDGQGDLAGHGGEHRAVLVYQIASYGYWQRSEEHTSELQSRVDLVCRLLLEKKTASSIPTASTTSCNGASRRSATRTPTSPRPRRSRPGCPTPSPAFCLFVTRRPPRSTLFPYTTLFR